MSVGSNYGEGMKDGVGQRVYIGIVASVGHHVRASNYVLTFSSVTVQVDRPAWRCSSQKSSQSRSAHVKRSTCRLYEWKVGREGGRARE